MYIFLRYLHRELLKLLFDANTIIIDMVLVTKYYVCARAGVCDTFTQFYEEARKI